MEQNRENPLVILAFTFKNFLAVSSTAWVSVASWCEGAVPVRASLPVYKYHKIS